MRRVLRLVARSDVEDEQSYRRERREWYYLPIRRLLLFLEHSIGRATRWVVFETLPSSAVFHVGDHVVTPSRNRCSALPSVGRLTQGDPPGVTETQLRLFYATDVHGSTRCFTKFVNAAEFYGVDAVLLGGDITGKAIVPLVAENGRYRGHFLGEPVTAEPGEEFESLVKKIAATGYYAWRCTPDEEAEMASDRTKQHALFIRLITDRVEQWMRLAEERLAPLGIPCFVNAGNDDPPEIDSAIEASSWVQFLEGRVVDLPDGTQVASCGYANVTPWHCPRDVPERELARRIDDVVDKLEDPGRAIFNFHCPPYGTGIDDGPKLGEDFRLTAGAAGIEMVPVGSMACRAAIERHQPLLGVHGHLHESRGTYKLGRTLCVNPGSEYTEGVLRGALFELRDGKVKSHQFTVG